MGDYPRAFVGFGARIKLTPEQEDLYTGDYEKWGTMYDMIKDKVAEAGISESIDLAQAAPYEHRYDPEDNLYVLVIKGDCFYIQEAVHLEDLIKKVPDTNKHASILKQAVAACGFVLVEEPTWYVAANV